MVSVNQKGCHEIVGANGCRSQERLKKKKQRLMLYVARCNKIKCYTVCAAIDRAALGGRKPTAGSGRLCGRRGDRGGFRECRGRYARSAPATPRAGRGAQGPVGKGHRGGRYLLTQARRAGIGSAAVAGRDHGLRLLPGPADAVGPQYVAAPAWTRPIFVTRPSAR